MSGKDDPKIDEMYTGFKRRAEQINKERVSKLVKTNKSNKLLGLILTSFVGSVYLYSMFAVKQEKFLDEIVDLDDTQQVKT
ncbi:cytochrome c oxidase assembly factor 3, mitochondrial-like [Oppia nitens]|uniref:cytochrome c oxidase assembly factor 3, mitochondrial-like n=1 Tax=Oppia nitens TaxID=1686743 RepID=UPI0023DA6705|nr:cytochrome c oxidase assembly factor 3, mitochondrial-like [Oppia nitens]